LDGLEEKHAFIWQTTSMT